MRNLHCIMWNLVHLVNKGNEESDVVRAAIAAVEKLRKEERR